MLQQKYAIIEKVKRVQTDNQGDFRTDVTTSQTL